MIKSFAEISVNKIPKKIFSNSKKNFKNSKIFKNEKNSKNFKIWKKNEKNFSNSKKNEKNFSNSKKNFKNERISKNLKNLKEKKILSEKKNFSNLNNLKKKKKIENSEYYSFVNLETENDFDKKKKICSKKRDGSLSNKKYNRDSSKNRVFKSEKKFYGKKLRSKISEFQFNY